MAHTTTVDFPDDVWEDIQKRKFRNEGSIRDLILRAYRTHYNIPAKDEEPPKSPEVPPCPAQTADVPQ